MAKEKEKEKRETDEERAARDREERIALLKMKQGIIEESEIIPETGYAPPPKQGLRARFSSFIYRNKAYVVLGAIFAAIAAFLIVQLITQEKEDLNVLVVAYDRNSSMINYTQQLEKALEMYCPDFDGNGKVHVAITFIDRTTRDMSSQYDDAQSQKLNLEIESGTAKLVIADEEFMERVNPNNADNYEVMRHYFLEQTDKLPKEELFYDCGIRVSSTQLPSDVDWKNCPNNVYFMIFNENVGKKSEKSDEYRKRAEILLQNILENNIVNPPAKD